MEKFDSKLLSDIGWEDGEYVVVDSMGLSGGIILIWDPSFFRVEVKFTNSNYVCAAGKLIGSNIKVVFLCVYAPQETSVKNHIWDDIQQKIVGSSDAWVCCGDWNAVRSPDERDGTIFDANDAFLFNRFIANSGLHDIPIGGKRFTRFSTDGTKKSKLDRFLITSNFLDRWPDVNVTALPRLYSDHCPLLLKVDGFNSGPKPFRFFDHWLEDNNFISLVNKAWNEKTFNGSSDIQLKNKIKYVRRCIANWKKLDLEKQRARHKKLQEDLVDWDKQAEEGRLGDLGAMKRQETIVKLLKMEQEERLVLKQKCRFKWNVEGDENSRFFHATINKKRKKNNIKGLMINGIWVEDPDSIKAAALDHFKKRFEEPCKLRPSFYSDKFKKLSQFDRESMEADFTMEEMEEAVRKCSSSKAPGPDGMNFKFIKFFWPQIKLDFFHFIKHFEASGRLGKGCNASNIVLIPKKADPLTLSDFRPISLLGCGYKIIAKILSKRLARVIPKIISNNQTGFIRGRQILDGVVVANEVMNWAKYEKKKLLIFKADFEKAFDCVNWEFLISIMDQMGFGSKWCKWIKGCLRSASISVLVNGSPSMEFSMERGLRQGDSLSPFLFLIVGEALRVMFSEAYSNNIFKGLKLANGGVDLSLLQFADDTLFFGRWSKSNASNLIRVLKCFQEVSGLKINVSKSTLYGVGVEDSVVKGVARSLNCVAGNLPFIYLGLPIGKSMKKQADWREILDRINKRLNLWKAHLLSVGGRLTLIKSVLGALPIYYLSLFRAPGGIINSIESLRCRFFWGMKEDKRGIYWIAWKDIIKKKDKGGLGVGSINAMNVALLAKWKWRFLTEPEALWRKVIVTLHGENGGFGVSTTNRYQKGIWSSIISSIKKINDLNLSFDTSFSKKVGNGESTFFWKDVWGERLQPLKEAFPRLYALETNKNCLVIDRWGGERFNNWSWRLNPRGRAAADLDSLSTKLTNDFIDESKVDSWRWNLANSGIFSVCNMKRLVEDFILGGRYGFDYLAENWWINLVPRKVNIFMWKACMDKLPTLSNLCKKGIMVQSPNCIFCSSQVETLGHLFFDCGCCQVIWRKVWHWWIPNNHPKLTFNDIMRNGLLVGVSELVDRCFRAVCYTTFWSIWRWRNMTIHANSVEDRNKLLREDLFSSIQRVTFDWVDARREQRSERLNWDSWLQNPIRSVGG